MPIILILVVVLVAGGFFKMKSGGKKEEPAVKLGETETLGEFLLNVNSDGDHFLRTEISMQVKEGFKKEEFEKNLPAIKDEVLQVLRTKSVAELSARNMPALKFEIATKVNKLLEESAPKEEAKDSEKKKKHKKKGESDEPSSDPEERDHPDWDSDEGPVLKVYFTSFATQ